MKIGSKLGFLLSPSPVSVPCRWTRPQETSFQRFEDWLRLRRPILTHSLTHSLIHSFILQSIHSLTHPSVLLSIHLFSYPSIHSLICPFIPSLIHPPTGSLIHSLLHPSPQPLHPSSCSLIRSFSSLLSINAMFNMVSSSEDVIVNPGVRVGGVPGLISYHTVRQT